MSQTCKNDPGPPLALTRTLALEGQVLLRNYITYQVPYHGFVVQIKYETWICRLTY